MTQVRSTHTGHVWRTESLKAHFRHMVATRAKPIFQSPGLGGLEKKGRRLWRWRSFSSYKITKLLLEVLGQVWSVWWPEVAPTKCPNGSSAPRRNAEPSAVGWSACSSGRLGRNEWRCHHMRRYGDSAYPVTISVTSLQPLRTGTVASPPC